MINSILGKMRGKTGIALGSSVIWQVANYAIPLITFPYLGHVLGPQGFGIVGLGVAVAAYALLLTDWGFIYTATQEVSRNRDDIGYINQIAWSTIMAKAFLAAASCFILLICTIFFIKNKNLDIILWVSMISVFGSVFNLDWLLRGTEHFSLFAITSVVGRLLGVPLVFLLVHNQNDIVQAAFSMAVTGPLTAIIILFCCFKIKLIRNPVLNINLSFKSILNGWHIFLSTALISVYTNSLSVILAYVSNFSQVGLFSGADKIRRPVQNLYAPIGMVFFPKLSYLTETAPEQAKLLSIKILHIQGFVSLILSLCLFFAAPLAIHFLLGKLFFDAVNVLRVMAWLIFSVGLSNVLGLMIMIPFGLKREFSLCVGLGSLAGLGLALVLSWRFGALGTATAALIAEIVVTVSMFLVLWSRFEWFRKMVFSISWGAK